MKRDLLSMLACPACLSSLAYADANRDPIDHGSLICAGCERDYDVHAGMPYLMLQDSEWLQIKTEIEGEEELVEELPETAHIKRNQFESRRSYRYLKSVELPRDPLVLDIGGSAGIGSLLFQHMNARVVITEIVPRFLKIAEKVVSEKVPVDPVVASMKWLPFQTDTFDVVFCRQALHHAACPPDVMREFFRVTRPGGTVLVISEPCQAATDGIRTFFSGRKKSRTGGKYDALMDKLPDEHFQYTWPDFKRIIQPLTGDFSIERADGSAGTVFTEHGLDFEPYCNRRGPLGKILNAVLPGGWGYRGDVNIQARKTRSVQRNIPAPDAAPVPASEFPEIVLPDDEIARLKTLFATFFEGFEW